MQLNQDEQSQISKCEKAEMTEWIKGTDVAYLWMVDLTEHVFLYWAQTATLFGPVLWHLFKIN